MRFHALMAAVVLGLALPSWAGSGASHATFSTPYSFALQPANEPATTDEGAEVAEETQITEETINQGPVAGQSVRSSYLITSDRLIPDIDWPWPGFLVGQRANSDFHEAFAEPVGNPLYFESPVIETQMKIIYMWHDFPSNSQIGGGELNMLAFPFRIALTDRLQVMVWKDGYTDLNAGILSEGSGWNDLGIGLKYAFIQSEAHELMAAGGVKWEMHNGSFGALQGGPADANELDFFLTMAKGWGRFHVMADAGWRCPMNRNYGNHIIHWDVHTDYEVLPDILPGFFPLFEVHGLHYISDADRMPLAVGGLDVTNLGSYDVACSFVMWGDIGFRWKLTPNASIGAAYGFPLVNPSTDTFNQRVTVDVKLTY